MTTKSLLLVEDDSIILMVLEDFLTSAGYEVVTAIDGNQALGLLEQDAPRFSAVLTDVRLGSGPDGWQVAGRARELIPDMPLVYMSGDSAYEWASRGVSSSVILPKPFEPEQLVRVVDDLVEQGDRLVG